LTIAFREINEYLYGLGHYSALIPPQKEMRFKDRLQMWLIHCGEILSAEQIERALPNFHRQINMSLQRFMVSARKLYRSSNLN
jgi:hypothetical protein